MNVSICHRIIKNISRNGAFLEPKGGDSQIKRMLFMPFLQELKMRFWHFLRCSSSKVHNVTFGSLLIRILSWKIWQQTTRRFLMDLLSDLNSIVSNHYYGMSRGQIHTSTNLPSWASLNSYLNSKWPSHCGKDPFVPLQELKDFKFSDNHSHPFYIAVPTPYGGFSTKRDFHI